MGLEKRNWLGRRLTALQVGWFLVALATAGCGSSSNIVSLSIVSPDDGEVFTGADDQDPDQDGVQIEIEVESVGLNEEDEIRLRQNDEIVATQEAASEMTFVVTLRRGTNNFDLVFEGDDYSPLTVEFTDTCGEVQWIEPRVPDGDELVLGGNEEFCEGDQSIEVVVAVAVDDGTTVQLLVNDTVADAAAAQGGIARFDDVTFGMRETGNDLAVRVSNDAGGGESCAPVAFPAAIEVDCEGPDCAFGEPVSGLEGALTSADDVDSGEAGLQVGVEVVTDGSASGQPVTLVVNGRTDQARMVDASTQGSEAVATFSSVSFNDGSHSLLATCVDDLGNQTNAMAQIEVDVEACEIEVVGVSPALDDQGRIVASTPGESVEATLTVEVDGDDCAELRAVASGSETCNSVSMADPMAISPGDASQFELSYTLDSAGEVFLCAEVRDASGNRAVASQELVFFNGTPQLELSLPPDETREPLYNKEGTGGRIADEVPGTTPCEASFVVSCEGPMGEDLMSGTVELFIDSDGEEDAAALASAPCNNGVAVFDSVPLPTRDNGATGDLRARTTFSELTGFSTPLEVQADCRLPSISLTDNQVCGANIETDVDDASEGIQFPLTVLNNNSPQRPVEVTVYTESPRTEVSVQTSNEPNAVGTGTVFSEESPVDFSSGGELIVEACTDDAAGNVQCAECLTIVGDVPEVAITSPAQGELLSQDLDVDYVGDTPPPDSSCPGSGTFNIRVQAEAAGAIAGADTATVQIGANDRIPVPVLDNGTVDDDSDNRVDACVPADGVDGQSVTIMVRATNGTGYGRSSITVGIDTQAPGAASGITKEEPCRGFPTLSWDDMADTDPTIVGYEVRCSDSPITTHEEWNAADVLTDGTLDTSVGLNGGVVGGRFQLNPGDSAFCAVRAFDQAGAYSELVAADEALEAAPLSQVALADFPTFPGDSAYFWGLSPHPVGDVNGDGMADFVVSGGAVNGERVFLYLGQKLRPEEPGGDVPADPVPIELRAGAAPGLGFAIHPLGNFDDDDGGDDGTGTDDFVISSYADPGIAYVVTGRSTGEWPAAAELDLGGCSADICVALGDGDAGDYAVRHAASAGTFNPGDSIPDLAIGGWREQPVIVLGDDYPQAATLGATGSGLCLDARVDQTDPPDCATGQGSEVARGFRVLAPVTGARGGLATADQNDLYYAAGGGPTTLYRVPATAYPAGSSGLVNIDLLAGDSLGTLAAGALTDIEPLGDYNGDGLEDYGVYQADYTFRILLGTEPSGLVDTSAQLVVTNDQPERGGLWGYRPKPGYVPQLGSLAEINGDGADEVAMSAGGRNDADPQGAADLIWGDPDLAVPDAPQNSTRSALVGLSFDSTTLDGAPSDVAPLPRRIGFVGDYDGDGWNDLVLVEGTDDPAGLDSVMRTILIGTCE